LNYHDVIITLSPSVYTGDDDDDDDDDDVDIIEEQNIVMVRE
jgi:hypothetical protein